MCGDAGLGRCGGLLDEAVRFHCIENSVVLAEHCGGSRRRPTKTAKVVEVLSSASRSSGQGPEQAEAALDLVV